MRKEAEWPGEGNYWICNFCARSREVLHFQEGLPHGWISHKEMDICEECVAKAIMNVLEQIRQAENLET